MGDRLLAEDLREMVKANEASGVYMPPAMNPREVAGKISDAARRDEVLASIALMEAAHHHHVAVSTDQRVVAILEARVRRIEAEKEALMPRVWAAEGAQMAAEYQLGIAKHRIDRLERDLSVALGRLGASTPAPPPAPVAASAPPPRPRPPKAGPPMSPALRRAIDDMMARPPPDPIGIAEERRIEEELGRHQGDQYAERA